MLSCSIFRGVAYTLLAIHHLSPLSCSLVLNLLACLSPLSVVLRLKHPHCYDVILLTAFSATDIQLHLFFLDIPNAPHLFTFVLRTLHFFWFTSGSRLFCGGAFGVCCFLEWRREVYIRM